MVCASKEMVVYCFDNLLAHFTGHIVPPPTFDEGHHPLFVTWKRVIGGDRSLRGCTGSLKPSSLFNGLRDYALRSALLDGRFPAIEGAEIPNLECTVSILTDYEDAANYLDWEIGKHGMIIEFTGPEDNTRHVGTYLPGVAAEQGWTKTETIDSLMRKSGYMGSITESLRTALRIIRYPSSVYSMQFYEYATSVYRSRGTVPSNVNASM